MRKHRQLFTNRQLVALTTFSDLVLEAREQVVADARAAGLGDDGHELHKGGLGVTAYGDAVAVYLALGVSKATDYNSALVSWSNSRDQAGHVFTKQTLSMLWDFCEVNPFASAAGDLVISLNGIAKSLLNLPQTASGYTAQRDARTLSLSV